MQKVQLPKTKKQKEMNGMITFQLQDNRYYTTRGGWLAKCIYVNPITKLAYVIHNPSTEIEAGPVMHSMETGFAIDVSLLNHMTPPAYNGHPADITEEVNPN